MTNCASQPQEKPPQPRTRMLDNWVQLMDKRLHLTRKQEQQLRAILAESRQEMQRIRRKYADAGPHGRAAMRVELERLHAKRRDKIEQILTPQQRLHYREMQAEIQERMWEDYKNNQNR